MMTTTLSIDAGIASVGVASANVPMTASLAENALSGAAFEAAVTAFQAAMAVPQEGLNGLMVKELKGLGNEGLKLAGESAPITTSSDRTVAVSATGADKHMVDSAPVATPETLKAVVTENGRIAAELPKTADIPVVTADVEVPVLQAAPMTVPVESAAVQQVVADVKVATLDAASARTQILVDAVEAVCDAILVTPGLVRGQGEMLIRLKPDVLSGTEIRLEEKGQTLTVAFIPATTEVSALIERNLLQFEQHLAGRIHNYQIAARVNVDERKLRG